MPHRAERLVRSVMLQGSAVWGSADSEAQTPSHPLSLATCGRGQTTGNTLTSPKNRAKLLACFFDIFSSAIMSDLTMTFTSRHKMDAKCANQQWNLIRVANYFGTPPADRVHGYLSFEPGALIWTKGFRRLSAFCEEIMWTFSLNSARVRALGWPFLGFFRDYYYFFRGGCGVIHLYGL